jgi:phosphate transport system substrate-binding protein
MKTTTNIILAFLLTTVGIQAQNTAETILISAPKFAQSLVESWIAEYTRSHPRQLIQLQNTATKGQTAQLSLVVEPSVNAEENKIIYTARYALLPVTSSRNTLLTLLGKKRLDKKTIDKLFFEPLVDEEDEEESPEAKPKYLVTVYSAENTARLSNILASHYGHLSSELRGKKVLGDDIYLLSALKKDTTGISYNSLSYIYDLNSRRLKPDLAVLPIEIKKEARPQLNGSADDLISLLESERVETIPVGRIGFTYNQTGNQEALTSFLQWTLTEGQKINHKQGFLQAEEIDRSVAQRDLQASKLLTLK